jgi:hypothetical protein
LTALARRLTPRSMRARDSSPKWISFAVISFTSSKAQAIWMPGSGAAPTR